MHCKKCNMKYFISYHTCKNVFVNDVNENSVMNTQCAMVQELKVGGVVGSISC